MAGVDFPCPPMSAAPVSGLHESVELKPPCCTYPDPPLAEEGVLSDVLDHFNLVIERVPTPEGCRPGEGSQALEGSQVLEGSHALNRRSTGGDSAGIRVNVKSTLRTVGQYTVQKDGVHMVKSGHSVRIPRSAWGVAAIMPIVSEVNTCRDWFRTCFLSYLCLFLSALTQIAFVYGIKSITLLDNEFNCDELAMDASLVMLCIMLYLLSVLNDMEETFDLAELYFDMIPTVSGHSQLLYFDEDNQIAQGGFSCARKLVLGVVVLSGKLIIAVLLGINGTLYLASSANDSELLLNTLALEFVLGVDEMIYISMAPMSTRSIMLQIPPLRIQERRAFFRWTDTISPICKVILCLWVSRLALLYVNPTTADCVLPSWFRSD